MICVGGKKTILSSHLNVQIAETGDTRRRGWGEGGVGIWQQEIVERAACVKKMGASTLIKKNQKESPSHLLLINSV